MVEDIAIGVRSLGFDSWSGRIFRNGCIENFHFALQRSDWLDQLREYAASNEIFCLFYYHYSSHPEFHVKETNFVENKI